MISSKYTELIKQNFKVSPTESSKVIEVIEKKYDLSDISDQDFLQLFDSELSKLNQKSKIMRKALAKLK